MTSSAQFPFGQPVVWQPNEQYVQGSRLRRLIDLHGLATPDELMERSTADIAWFWKADIPKTRNAKLMRRVIRAA